MGAVSNGGVTDKRDVVGCNRGCSMSTSWSFTVKPTHPTNTANSSQMNPISDLGSTNSTSLEPNLGKTSLIGFTEAHFAMIWVGRVRVVARVFAFRFV